MKKLIHSSMEDSFRQFSRNGVWGTCVDCPRTNGENAFPEFCQNSERYDHQLKIEDLVQQHKIRLHDVLREQKREEIYQDLSTKYYKDKSYDLWEQAGSLVSEASRKFKESRGYKILIFEYKETEIRITREELGL